MNFYLSPLVKVDTGLGLVWRPVGVEQPGAGCIDLSVGNVPSWALLALPIHDPNPKLKQIGADASDTLSNAVKTLAANTVGYTDALRVTTVKGLVAQFLTQPPTGKWQPVKPLRSGLSEIWIGGQQLWNNAGGGSLGMGGLTIGVDQLIHRADFSSRNKFHYYWMDWVGYLPLCALAVLASWDHPEWWPLLGVLPKTDLFTGTDGTALTTYDASYTYITGTFILASNAMSSNTGSNCIAAWTGDTFSAAHYAEGTFGALGTNTYAGVSTRGSGTSGYHTWAQNGDTRFRKTVTGTTTELNGNSTAWAANDVIRLESEGSTHRTTKNGTAYGSSPYTDTAVTGGGAGLGAFGSGTSKSTITTLVLGNLGAVSTHFFTSMGVGL